MAEQSDWFRPVAEYMLREGLPETLRLAVIAVTASVVVGILLGVLMTIKFRPLQWLIRLYVEVWRGLPILVTVLFIYWLPDYTVGPFNVRLNAYMSAAVALSFWGALRSPRQRAERCGRFRRSSTRPPQLSALAGPVATSS